MPKREDHWKEFVEWGQKNGVPVEKFEIKKVKNDEYGLFTTDNHSENDVLFEINRKIFMTNETATNDTKLGPFFKFFGFFLVFNLIHFFKIIIISTIFSGCHL